MSTFGKTSTTDEVLADKNLAGAKVFVTGGNSGLGQETARAMAAKGAHVILAGRDQAKLDAAMEAITAAHPQARLETIICDLGSLQSVRACGNEARERFDKIDLLINNAGIMAVPKGTTADGFESQFGTNHIGHFQLTKELMPLIRAGTHKRIVNLSSRGHQYAPLDLDDPHFEQREYDPFVSYGGSKTANVLFTVGLEERFGGEGIHAYAVHPGGIQTNLGRYMDEQMRDLLMSSLAKSDPDFEWKTEAQGAATQVWAATSDELEGRGGVYCEDCHVAEIDNESTTSGVRSYALDRASAEQLWAMSEQMIGKPFTA
ncbi:MAG: SDR family NAD(P)-dependent oxidoreductase [Pseudomonadota bacterium]